MGKFHQFLTELSIHHTIMLGYNCFTFLFQRTEVDDLVLMPLTTLILRFEAPNKVIQKRYDKLLDYDNMSRKAKDDKVGSVHCCYSYKCEKIYPWTCASSKGSDQSAHPHSLIRLHCFTEETWDPSLFTH